MRFREYLGNLARAEMQPPPDPFHVLNNLIKTPQLKALFCLAMSAYYRAAWDQGEQRAVWLFTELPTDALRARYGAMPLPDRATAASVSWFKSMRARDMLDAEERWRQRAEAYQLEALLKREGASSVDNHIRPTAVPIPR